MRFIFYENWLLTFRTTLIHLETGHFKSNEATKSINVFGKTIELLMGLINIKSPNQTSGSLHLIRKQIDAEACQISRISYSRSPL